MFFCGKNKPTMSQPTKTDETDEAIKQSAAEIEGMTNMWEDLKNTIARLTDDDDEFAVIMQQMNATTEVAKAVVAAHKPKEL